MALLDIPNEELGRMVKKRLWEVIGVSTILNIDLSSMHDEDANLGKRLSRKSKLRTPENEEAIQSRSANLPRHELVRQGKLLPMDDFLAVADVTQKKLNKSVASRKVFSVELEGALYIPAFFLSAMIHRNDFAKVVRRLVDTSGLSRWEFFTTPSEALGGATPLQYLAIKKVKHADGYEFTRSDNGVWLTEVVPPAYLSQLKSDAGRPES
ncbi:hypothetical protein IAG25_21435 [Caballeronia sp. EK]|uniref:hypothetical protein n=1 Tax=Caballeronia sp. EK TaxID=2767469 RepID=UPI0016553D8A|nr:hypothetical protein [Caballeronia sp. EK]MBC8639394.1 hypothetical protein [Caballeronia sp. EK]